MIDTEWDLRIRPLPDNRAEVREGRCPDCGSPLSVTETQEPACLLCGTWHPVTADREGTS